MAKPGRKPGITKEAEDFRKLVAAVNDHESPEDWLYSVLRALPCEPATSLPSEWAENNRYLPKSSGTPFPGKFSWTKSPFWREPLDHMSPHSPIQYVAIMKPTQIGFTCAVLENAVGFTIGAQPAPVLYVSGDENLVKTSKKMRLDPMIDNSGLRPKIRPESERKGIKRTGDSGNLTEFPGGYMKFCGPNVEANFQGISYKILLMDEVDLYQYQLGKSGETVSVIEGRADAFDRTKKVIYGSRPTVSFGIEEQKASEDEDPAAKKDVKDFGSRILDLYNAGDKRKYMVPCPHCGEKQELVFFPGTTHDGVRYGMDFDKEACKDGDYSSIRYLCRACGEGIKEYHKSEMVQQTSGAEWVPTGKAARPHFVSYHISALYSLTFSWESCVVEFLAAKGDPHKLQLFYNRILGLPFENRTGGVEVAKLTDKTGSYTTNTIPYREGEEVLYLTGACDVQRGKNARLEVEVRGHGRNFRSWGIDYRIFKGNTEDEHDDCYKQLGAMLDEVWTDKDGRRYQLERIVIDSGDGTVTSTVYTACRLYGQGEAALMLPLKGLETTARTREYFKTVELPSERFPLVEVYGDKYKNKMALWLKQDWRPGEAAPIGWPMFPTGEGYNKKYFTQLGNDERILIRKGAHTIVRWQKRGAIETWDVLCYNSACSDFVIEDYSKMVLGLEKANAEEVWKYFEFERGFVGKAT